MPTSFVGLVLFVLLLAPGMCYRWRRSVRRPVQKLSELRELASVALVSFVGDVVALGLFGAWRAWQPGLSLDTGRLVREPSRYIPATYVAVIGWVVAVLAVACAVGLTLTALADAAAVDGSAANTVTRWLRGSRDGTTSPMDVGAVVISARRLQFVTVTYVPLDNSASV